MASLEEKARVRPPCSEWVLFQNWMSLSRKADDNVILTLNATDGSLVQCSKVWNELTKTWRERNDALRECHDERARALTPQSSRQEKQRVEWLEDAVMTEHILQSSATDQFKSRCPGFTIPKNNS